MTTGNNSLNKRVDALVKYILDVKPYHTKLLGFTSEVNFSDALNLKLADSLPQHTIFHQNVWGVKDISTLSTVSDGGDLSRLFIIPPTVIPRFSTTDSVNYGQSPIGDDQALSDLADANADGTPDSAYPWLGDPSSSHQSGADIVPVRLNIKSLHVNVTAATANTYTATVIGSFDTVVPTLYGLPLGALELRGGGLTTVVNGWAGTFNVTISGSYSRDYAAEPSLPAMSDAAIAAACLYRTGFTLWAVVDTGRYAVPFHNGSRVHVNGALQVFSDDYIVDESRSFIQFLAGKHPAANAELTINLMNSDRIYVAICSPFVQDESDADRFTLTVSDAAIGRHTIAFTNLEPGKVKAQLERVMIYPSQLDGYTWEIKSNGFFSATVQQLTPIVGPIENAYLNEAFDNGKIAFELKAPWTEYYFINGSNSYVAYDLLPYDESLYDGPPDEADFWPDVDAKTQYGVTSDPLPPVHAPIQLVALGELRQRLVNGAPQYIFELYTTPPRGSYVELRIEQAKQLNPRLQLVMHESLNIVQLVGSPSSVIAAEVYSTHDITSVFP